MKIINGNRRKGVPRNEGGSRSAPTEGLVLRVSNVTSALSNVASIAKLAQDGLRAIRETRLDAKTMKIVTATLLRGLPEDQKVEFIPAALTEGTPSAGVALVAGGKARHCAAKLAAPAGTAAARFERRGRLGLFAVSLSASSDYGRTRREAILHSVAQYGVVHDAQESDALLEAVEELTTELGEWPVLVVGDFSRTLEEGRNASPVLRRWLEMGILRDVVRESAERGGREAVATTYGVGRGQISGTRVDHAWGNNAGAELVKSVKIEQYHYATHDTKRSRGRSVRKESVEAR